MSLLSTKRVHLGGNYPHRLVKNLQSARKRAHKAVMEVRRSENGQQYLLSDGNEFIHLPDGRRARCITRRDFRFNEDDPVTFQTPGEAWDARTRKTRRPLEGVMRNELETSKRCAGVNEITAVG